MSEKDPYRIPAATRIGHVHLKVSDLERSLEFYCGMLGFELITTYGREAAFISAGDYHHHIGLNVWYSKDGSPPPANSTGLFHTAICYPERKDLAIAYKRLLDRNYPVTGTADHGVSEAIYLNDPDRNGVELYWDRPRSHWPTDEKGGITMYTHPLNTAELLEELSK
ncbi:VOC family protein [Robertkochia aurantiaca]|uniref:VOC family protein n=1 Tax=Robertkochia aurantiaca TaxID=2873700 RepID=UPI001CCA195D|nr:VOC family protein [Robertkochia sp. 3YJGBD-33]